MKKLIRVTTVPISLEILLGNQLEFMKSFFDLTIVSSEKVQLSKVAERLKLPSFHIPMTRRLTPFLDMWSLFKMYRYLKTKQPHIVHSHTPKAGIVTMMAAYFAGVPVRMHTIAGLPLLEAKGIKRFLLDRVEKLTCFFATHVYPNSAGIYDMMLKEGFCEESKLKLIGNGSSSGIDLDEFRTDLWSADEIKTLRKEWGIHPDDFVYVFVGRLVGDKGINELIEAFHSLETPSKNSPFPGRGGEENSSHTQHPVESSSANIPRCSDETPNKISPFPVRGGEENSSHTQHPVESSSANMPRCSDETPNKNSPLLRRGVGGEEKLLLVGPLESHLDPLKPETLKKIEQNPNIIVTGFQKDVRPYLAISNCLVFPSYREGFPNVVMQAGAMGLPSIVSDINGCNEIIVDGKNGLIIPVKNAEAICEAMQKIKNSPALYQELKENARTMIGSRYEQSVVWNALLEEYRRVSP